LIIGAAIAVSVLLVLGLLLRPKKANPPQVVKPEQGVQKYLDQARESLKKGELPKAREIYSKIIEKYPDSDAIKEIQTELEKINIDILFSRFITKDSTKYIVQEGDALRKIAKRFNTTVELLKRSNDLTSDLIHPGKHLKVCTATFSILVDKSQNKLTLKANDEVFKVYTVSTGLEGTTPPGEFTIVNKLVNPDWFKAGAVVLAGSPDNILGSRWMGISEPGYGIHGTTEPETIGSHITAGCVRMRNEEVEELYSIVPTGIKVTIVE